MGTKRKKNKRRLVFLIIAAAFALMLGFSAVMLAGELRESKQEEDTFSELAALRQPQTAGATSAPKPAGSIDITIGDVGDGKPDESPKALPEEGTNGPVEKEKPEEPGEPGPLPQYLPLYQRNPEFFGWITVPDTRVDYPVMYCPKRPLYYMNHDFYGNTSYAGVPFLDADCDPNGNFYLVYGHKMRSGAMFGGLLVYEDKAFWEEHPTFRFDTLYEERTYEVVVAMRARILDRDEREGFRYYNYTSLDTEEEFEAYMRQARQLARYDTGIETAFGDELLVLSTCYHYTKNGRFVIIAKRVDE